MNPQIFGWQHLVYLLIIAIIATVGIILFVKVAKTQKTKDIIIKILAAILFALVLWNRILLALKYNDIKSFIPNTFCGLTSLILPIGIFFCKKDGVFFHFICYLTFIGSLLTMFYPDFIDQAPSLFYPLTISGLLHHTFSLFIVVLMVIGKWITPTIKKWYCLPLGLCCVMTYGLFIIDAFGLDAMNIHNPLIEGTIFSWWFVGILALILSYTIMCVFDYFLIWKKILKERKQTKEKSAKN